MLFEAENITQTALRYVVHQIVIKRLEKQYEGIAMQQILW
jgi:hypothetical protein